MDKSKQIRAELAMLAGMSLADMSFLQEYMDKDEAKKQLSSPYLIPHYPNNIQRGRKHYVPKDPDAHPQLYKFVVYGETIEARNKKEAFKKYLLKQIKEK